MSSAAYGSFLVIKPDRTLMDVPVGKPEFQVGQDAGCDLVLSGSRVMPFHAVFLWTGSALMVSDLDPRVGILVNKVPVVEHRLSPGDVVSIGEFRLLYYAPWSVPPPPDVPPNGAERRKSGGRRSDDPQLFKIPLEMLKMAKGQASRPSGALTLVLYTPLGPYSYALSPPEVLTIGSDPESDVTVSFGRGVKPRHARIEWEGADAVIVDAGGKSDVWVNGTLGLRRKLANGDFIKLGEARLVYQDLRAMAHTRALVKHVVAGVPESNELGKTVALGRDSTNDIVLRHLQVSRFHAEVRKKDGDYMLADLGSSNGTFLNGELIDEPTKLKAGDHIRISDFHLDFDGTRLQHYSEAGNARIDAIGLRRTVGKDRVVLHDVSFSIYPREIVALVGVSGAGKSVMLNALSGFRPADQGVVLVNGSDYYANLDSFRSTLGFVPEDDIIHRGLTVYRALYYAARLRIPEDTTSKEIEQRIVEVLSDLHLTELREVPVDRLPGGQKKCVSIGVEILTRPRLFFLDEPTSGLDPGMETDLMRIFRNLADKGHTLVVSTHATRNIMLCDKILFLSEGGHMVFFGSPSEALSYFETDDFSEIYQKVQRQKSPQQWAEEFEKSPHYQTNVLDRQKEVEALVQEAEAARATRSTRAERAPSRKKVSAWRQFLLLTQRYTEILMLDRGNLAILLGSAVVVALLIAILFPADLLRPFVASEYDVPGLATGARDLSMVLESFSQVQIFTLFVMLAPIFFGVSNSLREIAREIPVYKRERVVNLRVVPYLLSKVAVLTVVCLVQVTFLEVVLAIRFRFPGSDQFYLKLFLGLFVSALAAIVLGLACSAFASNENKASSALPLLIIPQLFLTGQMPKLVGVMKIVACLGLTKWSFEILANLFRIWEIFPSPARMGNPVILSHSPIDFLIHQGNELQESLALDFWTHLGILGLEGLAFLGLAILILLNRDRVKDQ